VVLPDDVDDDATLVCRMAYEWQAKSLQFSAPPVVDVSVSWTGVSGTTVSATADPTTFRGTLETHTTIDDIAPTSIRSHSCVITFGFSAPHGHSTRFQQYAVNQLSHTCQPEPVKCELRFHLQIHTHTHTHTHTPV